MAKYRGNSDKERQLLPVLSSKNNYCGYFLDQTLLMGNEDSMGNFHRACGLKIHYISAAKIEFQLFITVVSFVISEIGTTIATLDF